MPSTDSARRYAQAVFEIAREQGQIERWREDLRALSDVLSVPEVQTFLAAPRVPLSEKRAILERNLSAVSPLARNLALLLVRRGRVEQVRDILRFYEELANAERGVTSAEVITAVPLDPTQEARVRQMLQRQVKGELKLSVHVDPSIVGGIITRVGDQVLDGSTRTRLREMRERLKASALLEV